MKTKLYVQAFLKSLALDPTAKHAKHLLASLKEVLTRRGHERLMPSIARGITARLTEKSSQGLLLTVAREKDERKFKTLAKRHLGKHDADKEFVVRVDSDVIGGYELKNGSHITDATWRGMLLNLYHTLKA